MSVAMRYKQPEVQDSLARGYVLGTLGAAARRRCNVLRKQIPELDQRIRELEECLQPLAAVVPPLAPSGRVWDQIDASISPVSRSEKLPFWERLPFFRGLALASSLIAIALILFQLSVAPTPSVDYIAVLEDDGGQAQLVVTASEQTSIMDIRVFGDGLTDSPAYQLWAVSKTDGETRSLGLIDPGTTSQRELSNTDWRLIGDAHELLVTAEMSGGSAIGEPSNTIVSRGLCIKLTDG